MSINQTHPLVTRRNHSLRLHTSGMSLVEILVTVLVTSVGLLGIAALHLTSLRNNYDATMRTQASTLAGDVADRMRSNRSAAIASAYVIASGGTYATPTTRAQRDIAEWKTALAQLLPNGEGSIAVAAGGSNFATITITWSERGAGTIDFITVTEL